MWGAWCPECEAFTHQTAPDCGPWECESCASAPSIDEVAEWLIDEMNAAWAEPDDNGQE